MLKMLLVFVVLQLADLGTTVMVLSLGGSEQNPLIRHLMTLGWLEGLVLAKLIALGIGAGCYLAKKHRTLRICNVVFAAIVAWNVSIIVRLM